MHDMFLVASEAGHKTLWDPTILGVLVVISAFGLFCGSVYLLLSTNLGARLGFLVAMACLSGFMVLLSSLWITTATPLNSPKGRPAQWETIDVLTDLSESDIEAVRNISEDGTRVETEDDLGVLRPGVEAGLVVPEPEGEEQPEVPEFARFETSTDFLTDFDGFETFKTGGGTRWVVFHKPQYAVVQFCPKLEVESDPAAAPPPPTCDPLEEKQFAIMRYDYGSLRQPPWVYFAMSSIIFGLSLLGLHWHEQDQRAQKRAGSELQPVPTPGA